MQAFQIPTNCILIFPHQPSLLMVDKGCNKCSELKPKLNSVFWGKMQVLQGIGYYKYFRYSLQRDLQQKVGDTTHIYYIYFNLSGPLSYLHTTFAIMLS